MKLGWRVAALVNGFQDAAAYRYEYFFEILASALIPAATQLVLWHAIFKIGGAATLGGMTHGEMIRYTLFSVLFAQVRGGNLDFEMAEQIRTGQLNNHLLRPVSYVEFVYLKGSAHKLVTAGFCLVIGLVMAPFLSIPIPRILGAMALALVGNVIHYQISAAIASAAFYWEEAYSVLMVKNMVAKLLSGEMLPLHLFPSSLHWIWQAAPFQIFVYAPTQYALGLSAHADLASHLLLGAGWLVGGAILIRVTWAIGLKRYLGIGG